MEAERAKRSKTKVKDEADESSDAGEEMGGPNSDSLNELGQGNLISKFKAGPLIELWLTAVFELKGSSESCIRKSEVYERYLSYCRDNNIEATSTGAFGKILRRVFPTVECSRKGPRGHTKHYYKFFGPKAEPTPITPSQRMKALSQGTQQSQQIGGEKHPSLSSPYHSVGPTGPSSSSSQSTKSSRTGSGPSSYPSPPHLSHPPLPPPPHPIKPEASMFSGPFCPPTAHSHHYMPTTHPCAYPPSPHATTHPYLPEFHKTSPGRGGAEGFGVQSNNHNLNSNSGFMYAHPGPSSAAYLPHIKAETPPSPPYVSYGFSASPIPPYIPGGFRSLAAHPMAPPYSLSSHPFFPSGLSSSHYPPSDSVVNVPSPSSASSSSSSSLASSSTTSRSPSPHSKRGSPSLSDTSFSNSSALKSSSSSSSSGLVHSAAAATKKDSQAVVSSTTTVATPPSRETSDSPSSSSVTTASSLASPTTLTGQSRPSPTSQPARSASPFSSTTPTLPPLPAFNPRLFSASPLLIPSATSPVSFTSMISSASPSFHAEMVAPHHHHITHLPSTPTPRPSSSMSPFFGERHEGRESISPSIDLMSPSTSMFDSFRNYFSPYPLAGDFFIGDRESPITLPFPSPHSFLAQDKSKEDNNSQAHPAEEATSKQDSSLGSMHPPLKRPKPSHNPPIPFLKPSLPQPSSPSASSSSLAAAASQKKSSDKEAPTRNTEARAEQGDRKESGLHNSSGGDSGEGSNRASPSDVSLPSSDRIEGSERKHKRPRRSSSGKSKASGSDDEDDASGHSSAYKSGPHHQAEPDNNNERDKQGADHTPHTLGLSTGVTRPLLSRPDTSPFTPFSKKSAFNPGKSLASRRERREPLSPSSYSPGSPTSAFEAARPLSSATTNQSAAAGGGLHSHQHHNQHWSNAISQHRCPHFAFNLSSLEDELQQQLAMKEPSHNNKKEQKTEELAQLAKRFNGLYQRHLQQLFDAVASLQFNEIKSILFQFWSSAIEDFGDLFQCQTITQQIKEVDEAMYNSLVVAILDNPFQPLASELSSMLMNFVVVFPVWLQKALQDVPASLRSKKLRAAELFCAELKRRAAIGQLGASLSVVLHPRSSGTTSTKKRRRGEGEEEEEGEKESQGMDLEQRRSEKEKASLSDDEPLVHLWTEWQKLDFASIVAMVEKQCGSGEGKESERMEPVRVEAIFRDISFLLQQNATGEDWLRYIYSLPALLMASDGLLPAAAGKPEEEEEEEQGGTESGRGSGRVEEDAKQKEKMEDSFVDPSTDELAEDSSQLIHKWNLLAQHILAELTKMQSTAKELFVLIFDWIEALMRFFRAAERNNLLRRSATPILCTITTPSASPLPSEPASSPSQRSRSPLASSSSSSSPTPRSSSAFIPSLAGR